MVQLLAVRRLVAVVAFAVCALLVALTTTSAEARSRYRGHHVQSHYSHHHHHHARRHHARRHHAYRRHSYRRHSLRQVRHAARIERARYERKHRAYAALVPQDGVTRHTVPLKPEPQPTGSMVSNVVAEARRYIGGNPTGRRSLWCARFMNLVLQRSGHSTSGSDMARSFANYGRRVSGPQVGAIAVMSRGRSGGHVGVVSGIDAKGNPIVVSGNHGRRVAEATYSRSRVYAYVMPN